LQSIKNALLSRNFDQNMHENALLFEKIKKNCCSVGDSSPKTLLASGGWGLCHQTPELFFPSPVTVTFSQPCSPFKRSRDYYRKVTKVT